MEQMLTTLISEQKRLADGQTAIFTNIDHIKGRLEDIIRIEERQVNDRQALNRMGKEIDSLNNIVKNLTETVTTLRISSARNLAIGGGSGSAVTAAAGFIIWLMGGPPG